MKILNFFKEHIFYIFFSLALIFFTVILLHALKVSTYAIVLICTLFFMCNFIYLIFNYKSQKKYLDNIQSLLSSLDKKYLLSELIDKGDTEFQKGIFEVIKECNKSMSDNVAEIERENKEYREFVELWVHEIKTPIASSKFTIENNKNEVTASLKHEINKIDDYVEKALFYARSSSVEKDYIIKKINLETLINTCIKKDASYLIEKGVRIEKSNLDYDIYTDEKWVEFILHQIISNSIKYFNKDINTLSFSSECKKEKVILSIRDNGIGMNEKSMLKAFDKGYTGENGRKYKESTGIGLYLSKKLCSKLGLEIYINSKEGEWTEVRIIFPIESLINF